MKESLLHYIWRTKAFALSDLQTTCGKTIALIDNGTWNHDAGPDFLHARIQIDNTLWVGHVEIHVKASDWTEHGHQRDPVYESVILHVVYENDTIIRHENGKRIPCLELKRRISRATLNRYWQIMHNSYRIPCEGLFPSSDRLLLQNCLDRMLLKRLQVRMLQIKEVLKAEGQDWENAFYRILARCFGLPINREPFEVLATTLPLRTVLKYQELHQVEALFFGQAGLLLRKRFTDSYPKKLQKEYLYLRKKHQLEPIPFPWKFSRLRPASFPTIRIAQFASLIHINRQLISKCLEAESIDELYRLFSVSASRYWDSHYQFDRYAKRSHLKKCGRAFITTLLINGVIPFVFTFGRVMHKPGIDKKALKWLERLPAERNRITRLWSSLGWEAQNAFDSQGLIHLYKEFCLKKKCLDCNIGASILNRKKT